MGRLSPIKSEFDTTEEQAAYEVWFRSKVEASLADTRPPMTHDVVMAELDGLMGEAKREPPTQ